MHNATKGPIALVCLAAIILLVWQAVGCGGSNRAPGFFVKTLDCTFISGLPPICIAHPGAWVNGSWARDLSSDAVGNRLNFPLTATDSNGNLFVSDGRLPAVWTAGVIWNLPCFPGARVDDFNVTFENPEIGWACREFIRTADLEFSPNPLYWDQQTGAATITGQGFSGQFGMPLVQYLDWNGNLVEQTNASAVADDGSWIVTPVPNLANFASGTYFAVVANANATGEWDVVGAAPFDLVTPAPPPPPPPDDGGCGSTPDDPCIVAGPGPAPAGSSRTILAVLKQLVGGVIWPVIRPTL